ncbi:MAG: hypothetical protein HFI67_10785 [Lachnospiraceae bacterium]|jgi:predicted transport protein|nr:hypothetical protein [Lachnospiraceae bacterium]
MNGDSMLFFDRHMDALPLYEAFKGRVMDEIEDVHMKVQKSQISFYKKHLFACVSFARVRKKKDCPEVYIVVTFGLARKKESPRIDVATEPYPGRWTHHVLISELEEIDDELLSWVREAAEFSAEK